MFTLHQPKHLVWGRWLLLAGALCALAGYFSPWVDHAAAGLAILGIDLGEYVKFLPPVSSGEIALWREGFYLPLFAVALTLALFAFRSECRYPLWVRGIMLIVGAVSALNMVPPAWTPRLLLTPEFRLQTIWIATALSALAVSPLLALLPRWFASGCAVLLALASAIVPTWMFLKTLPAIEPLYNHTLAPARGFWLLVVGLVMLAAGALLLARPVTNLAKPVAAPAVS